jgi:hypothetical protein
MRKQARRESARAWVRSGERITVNTCSRQADGLDDERFGDPDWALVEDRWMFVVGYTPGGVPFGCYEDEFDDLP